MKYIISALFLFSAFGIKAQNTLSPDASQKSGTKTEHTAKNKGPRVLLIPFDPKLYISEIDKSINKETQMNFDQIRSSFLKGLDFALFTQFKTSTLPVSLLFDTAKTNKDLAYIHYSTGLSYDPVPEAGKPVAQKNQNQKAPSKIKNGQLVVESDDNQHKFMNATINNPELLNELFAKYQTNFFLFINELDIKNNTENYDLITDTYQRDAIVHYTIIDKSKKEICSGIATSKFRSDVNNPSKISNTSFPLIAASIYDAFVKATTIK